MKKHNLLYFKQIIAILYITTLALSILLTGKTAHAATYSVTNLNDIGAGSLRWAIEQANINPGLDTIQFNIEAAVLCGGGVCTIQPLTPLPALTDGGTTIDGYTQPGASPATAADPAIILIELNGGVVVASSGLTITSANNMIRGLSIGNFSQHGIFVTGAAATGNVVAGNYIGLRADGETIWSNSFDGVMIAFDVQDNLVGGSSPAERNVISANWHGIQIWDDCSGNTISGNFIGTNASGTAARGNTWGITISRDSPNNSIGGDTAGERNLISGNDDYGVMINMSGSINNTVSGNYIGTDVNGTAILANGDAGIILRAPNNLIGGDTVGERNLISGNAADGVEISGSDTMSNTISGNYIGTDVSGTGALANGNAGVFVHEGAQYNLIGGDTEGERNLIAGNVWDGVNIGGSDTVSNTVSGNYIGTNASGAAALGNFAGVYIHSGAQYNSVGPDNLISGNTESGIEISSSGTMSNIVSGNYIGIDANGRSALSNEKSGVFIHNGAQLNVIGLRSSTDDENKRNIISGNSMNGVRISGADTADNMVGGNHIGLDASGTAGLGNTDYGIFIDSGAQSNLIVGNTISANEYGLWIQGENTFFNIIISNNIGTAANGVDAVGNVHDGVRISIDAQANQVIGNTIACNGDDGVAVDTPTAFDNLIWANSIHDNDEMGIHLTNDANHGILPPDIDTAVLDSGTLIVSGAACPDCMVQVFASPDGDGEGQIYLGLGVAGPAGDFDVAVSELPHPYLTATATGTGDGTSEFSAVYTVDLPILDTSTKSADRAEVRPGEILTYTLTLTNTGTIASAATLTDTLPAEVAWVGEYSASAGLLTWDAANNRLLWSGSVGLVAPVTITYQVEVSDSLAAGTVITNTATLSGGLSVEIGPATVTVLEREPQHIYLPLILNND